MDLTQDITYRGFKLNDAAIRSNIVKGNGIGGGISGCVLDFADYSDVDVIQFMEKRSLEDGMDVGDVYKGARRVRLSGTLYGVSRADLYDRRAALRAALDPVLAQQDEPADKGYQPLYFSEPTLNVDVGTGFPSGWIDKKILAIPRSISDPILRDSQGGDSDDSLGLAWTAVFIARDPRVYGAYVQDYPVVGAGTKSGTLVNRGNYYAPLNMLVTVGSGSGTISVSAGTSVFTITVPASTGDRIIRVKGADKIMTVEEAGTEAVRMDLIAFSGNNTWSLVQPGSNAYSVGGLTLNEGSHMWFWESYS